MVQKLYRVNLSYACYGIVTENDTITKAPPIAGWMLGKTIQDIEEWICKKAGTLKLVRTEHSSKY